MRVDKRFVPACALVVALMLVSCAGAEGARQVRGDLTSARTFKDCPSCPQVIVIPAGSFTMGSSQNEQDWAVEKGRLRKYTDREAPQHSVTLARSFAVGVYEVTRVRRAGEYSNGAALG
jgi:formylglycine-generating enzyme required for sulfatase activity